MIKELTSFLKYVILLMRKANKFKECLSYGKEKEKILI